MRHSVKIIAQIGVILIGLMALSQFICNSRYLHSLSLWTLRWSDGDRDITSEYIDRLVIAARNRAYLYEAIVEREHLSQGLVVNRRKTAGQIADQCDSLLFSSLRWVSLLKFGWKDRAHEALASIRKSQVEGSWIRHPECFDRSLSRDMLMGILIVLSQRPLGHEEDLLRLVSRIRDGGGFFSDGPGYVSYLTPGLGKILRMLLRDIDLQGDLIPSSILSGYSTNEVSLLFMSPGYEAHLAGLALWLEMELGAQEDIGRGTDFVNRAVGLMLSYFWSTNPFAQSHKWVALRLVQVDPKNLFFRYLWFRSIGALNARVASRLLSELLQMPQFPQDRLPSSCDRTADFMWQRGSHEYSEIDTSCERRFHGTDFLWMASLLIEVLESPNIGKRSLADQI